ncbi:MAG: helix-turn-helix domain-containing protein [Oscillospiraceae bacterium]|jgi:beta-xylosidase/AraC-like DNA-binding protein|nr:helix-turn-helix domain-containing protein [Ruminococcus sp. AM49-8]RGH17157.1 helix-turn-helix domain-containing protein [Ruminococcus sp. AF12-5]UYJ37148.1 MAG: helix-turn-helix domain-containing protein [Oscillospiraceae bacterium]
MREYIKKNKMDVQILSRLPKDTHFHQEVELVYVMEGELRLYVMEREYHLKRGDICVINSNEEHRIETQGEITTAHLFITYSLIRSVYNGVSSFFFCNSTSEDDERYEKLRELLNQLLKRKMFCEKEAEEEQHEYEYLSVFYKVLGYLTSNFIKKAKTDAGMSMQQKSQMRTLQINEYIMNNYNQPISLKSLADTLYLSEGYLSRYFKKIYNMSFSAYLRQVRLSHAMSELLYTDKAILQIALDNGFSSISFFNKVFKEEYGKSPSHIRNSAKEMEKKEEDMDSLVLNQKLEKFIYSMEEEQESKKRAKIIRKTFQVEDGEKIPQFWNTAINIGQASDLQNHEVRKQILRMKDSMHFRYIRFWSLFSDRMIMRNDEEIGQYNFTKLDNILDFLVENGLKPFFDMEEKIKRVNRTDKDFLLYEEKNNKVDSLQIWEEFIRQLIMHLVRRYGIEEVNTWKMEVIFDGYCLKGIDPTDSFFQIFKCTYSIIKKHAPHMEIGGCGFFPDYLCHLEKRGMNFWEEWIRRAPLPDFFSFMIYAYEADPEGKERFGKKSEDPDYLKNSIRKIRAELIQHGLSGQKIYITEWNLTVSDRNKLNDHCFHGAYVMKNIIDVFGEIDMLCYFTGTDIYTEYYDTVWLMHGGEGLLTRDGIAKPSGFAFRFLKKLKPYFIDKTENCLLTTDRRNQYSLVCHNMKNLNYMYYLQSEETLEWDKLWKNFDEWNPLTLKLCIKGVENGNYQMTIQKINEKSGSIQDIWADLEYIQDLSDSEIKYLHRATVPRMIIRKFCVEDECIEIELRMRPNEIGYINLEKM